MRVALTIRAALATVGISALSLMGCGSTSSSCRVPVREELDPDHLLHVTDPTIAKYRTDPPTSGVHLSTPAPSGLVDDPMLPAVQVTVLERGDVLVQYRDPADRPALEGLVGERVVVAPQPSLPARVVATAWTYKLTCSGIDTAAIRSFAASHTGRVQGH